MVQEPTKEVFDKGDDVPTEGEYVCSPCGYHHTFHKGEQFTECISCMSGTPDGHEDFAEGLELWEKAQRVTEGETPAAPPAI